MDYIKVNKVGIVIRELLTSFEVTNDEWKLIEGQLNELYLKESEKITLPRKKTICEAKINITPDSIVQKIN